MSYSYNTNNTLNNLSTKEDKQIYIFDISINNNIIIREVINNTSGFICIDNKIKFKNVSNFICKLLDLIYFKEYSVETNDIDIHNVLIHDKFILKLEDYKGNLTIFYNIN